MPQSQRCKATTKGGDRCKNQSWKDTAYCYIHRDLAVQEGQNIEASFRDRLAALFQTSRRFRVGAVLGFLAGLVGLVNALTGNAVIDIVKDIIPCTWPSTCVTQENALDVAYMMLEGQLESQLDCPDDLLNDQWIEHRKALKRLNFNRLALPYNEDTERYRDKLVEFHSDPPESEFECGVMSGELLLAARPMLVDFEINERKALSDGQGIPLAKGIGEMITGELGLKNQYFLFLGFRPERLGTLDLEARVFIEYLSIWMVMYFEGERSSAVERAQGALLGMSPDTLDDSKEPAFRQVHEDLILLSRSHTNRDSTGIVRYGSRAIDTLADLSLTVITEEQAYYVGGDRILKIVGKMNEVAQGGMSDLHELEQMIEMFKAAIPKED